MEDKDIVEMPYMANIDETTLIEDSNRVLLDEAENKG